jgi:hypothetical protein
MINSSCGMSVSRMEFHLLCMTLNHECLTLEVCGWFVFLVNIGNGGAVISDSFGWMKTVCNSCNTLMRLSPLVALALVGRSLTPTTCPSTYSILVVIEPLMAFWICFSKSPVASGLRVLHYYKSCFEPRMENLRVSTLKTEDLSLLAETRCSDLQHSGKYCFIWGTESRNLQLDPPHQQQHQPAQNQSS